MKVSDPLESIVRKRGSYKLILIGMLISVCSALTVVAYRYALTYADAARVSLFKLSGTVWGTVGLFAILLVLGFAAGKLTDSEPLIKGGGIPQVEGQLLGYFSPKWFRVLIKKFIGGAICMVGGLSLGRKGPSIQLGAMSAQGICAGLHRPREEQKYLIVCGACAGLAAAFNAPLAGVMFALEEMHKNFSVRALLPSMAAAITADIVSKQFFGIAPTLNFDIAAQLPMKYYILYLGIGILTGVLGAGYNKILLFTQKLYSKTGLPVWARIMIPFACAGILGLFMPEVLGSGHSIMASLTHGEYTLKLMILLLIVKFAFSMICFCSGAPGGIFFPLLVLGSLVGCIFGKLAVLTVGLPESYLLNFMLLGMAGMFSAAVRAPLTGILLIVEMSGSLTQLIGITVVACIACVVANLLRSRPIYESLLDNMTPDPICSADSIGHSLLDLVVPYDSPISGMRMSDIGWPGSCLAVSILRGSEQLIPHGDTVIEPGDVISVICPIGDEPLVQAAAGNTIADE